MPFGNIPGRRLSYYKISSNWMFIHCGQNWITLRLWIKNIKYISTFKFLICYKNSYARRTNCASSISTKKFYCLGWTIIYPGNKFYAQNIFLTKDFVLKEIVSKKREKRHISSLMCFTSLASVDGSTFFLDVNVCLLREKYPRKKFFTLFSFLLLS